MSVDCTLYVGYTVNLKNNLTSEDYDYLNDVDGYDDYECEGKVALLVDGMCGKYARLIFVDKKIEDIWDCKNYYKLRDKNTFNEVYSKLNEAYMSICKKKLDENLIEYAMTVHFS